jgi:hypothetical protein
LKSRVAPRTMLGGAATTGPSTEGRFHPGASGQNPVVRSANLDCGAAPLFLPPRVPYNKPMEPTRLGVSQPVTSAASWAPAPVGPRCLQDGARLIGEPLDGTNES